MRKSICATAYIVSTALGIIWAMPAFAQSASGDIIVTARRVEERLQDVPISIAVMNQSQLEAHNVVAAEDLARTTPSLQVNNNFGSDNTMFSLRGFTQDIGSAPTVGVYFGDVVAPRGGGFSTPSGDGAGPGSFFDLQNVQVLKGPQGTLQGRNTTGGAVMLVPQRPTHKLEGYVEGTLGNFDDRGVQAVLNVPLSETVRIRLGVDRHERDGYVINYSGIGPRDYGNLNNTAVRASMVADLTPNLENYTIASYSNSNTNGSVQKLIATTSGIGTTGVPGGAFESFGLNQLQRQAGLGFYGMLADMPDSNTRTRQWQVINTTKWDASDNLTVKNIISYAQYRQQLRQPEFGTDFKITNVNDLYAYLRYFNTIANFSVLPGAAASPLTPPFAAGVINAQLAAGGIPDPQTWANGNLAATLNGLVGSNFNYALINPNPGHEFSAESTFTEELQFQGRGLAGKLNWQGGFYFEKASPIGQGGAQTTVEASCPGINTSTPMCSSTLATALNSYISNSGANVSAPYAGLVIPPTLAASFPLSGGYNPSLYTNTLQDTAVYAQATYKLTPKLNLTGGFRYTWDKQNNTDDPLSVGYSANLAGAPTVTTFCANTALPAPPAGCYTTDGTKSSKPTWLVGLDWKPMNDVLLYAKYSRGYRAGGVKPDVIQTITSAATGVTSRIDSWQPEKVDAYEVGWKSSFGGRISGIFNVAGFYNDFSNQQVMLGLSAIAAPVPGQSTIANVGKSRIYGLEVDTSLNLFKGFVVSADYTYLNTKVQSVSITPGIYFSGSGSLFFVQPLAVAGRPLTYSPKNKVTFNATYTLPLDPKLGAISVGATFTHTDSQYANFNDTGTVSTIVQANGTLGSNSGDLGVLQPTNLLDLNAGWKGFAGSPLDLTFFMTNVTGEKYYTGVPGLLGLGFEVASLGAPRMWGVRVKAHF